MEIEINSYADLKELVGDYMPKKRLNERTIIKFAEELGLKDGKIFELVGNNCDLLFFCNYVVENYSDSYYLTYMRNKKYKCRLTVKEILGEYELRNKFDRKTIDKFEKEFCFDEEGFTEVYGYTNDWILFLNYLLENYPLTKKNNNNNLVDDGSDFDYIKELSSPAKE